MGLAASTGRTNYELVDKLIESGLVHDEAIERVMRIVDRGRFFPAEARHMAYRDLAWRNETGNPGCLHLSAPCIYANVLEYLELREGQAFLNIGSGTGYLNTLVGHLIGSNGVNHGIEIHKNIVEYAEQRIVEWVISAEAQCFDWAVPYFSVGNGLLLSPQYDGQYDRVYCGASVPANRKNAILELVRVDGIVVMPFEEQLLQMTRLEDGTFKVKMVTPVSFTDFIQPSVDDLRRQNWSYLPRVVLPSLQLASAMVVRKCIRQAMRSSFPIRIRNQKANPDPHSDLIDAAAGVRRRRLDVDRADQLPRVVPARGVMRRRRGGGHRAPRRGFGPEPVGPAGDWQMVQMQDEDERNEQVEEEQDSDVDVVGVQEENSQQQVEPYDPRTNGSSSNDVDAEAEAGLIEQTEAEKAAEQLAGGPSAEQVQALAEFDRVSEAELPEAMSDEDSVSVEEMNADTDSESTTSSAATSSDQSDSEDSEAEPRGNGGNLDDDDDEVVVIDVDNAVDAVSEIDEAEERERDEEQARQTEDIERSAAEFRCRVAELPLSKGLMDMIIHMP